MTDHLAEAKAYTDSAPPGADPVQLAIAHALIAIAERPPVSPDDEDYEEEDDEDEAAGATTDTCIRCGRLIQRGKQVVDGVVLCTTKGCDGKWRKRIKELRSQ